MPAYHRRGRGIIMGRFSGRRSRAFQCDRVRADRFSLGQRPASQRPSGRTHTHTHIKMEGRRLLTAAMAAHYQSYHSAAFSCRDKRTQVVLAMIPGPRRRSQSNNQKKSIDWVPLSAGLTGLFLVFSFIWGPSTGIQLVSSPQSLLKTTRT